MEAGTLVLIYGPFNYQGKFTSQSNEAFNTSLKSKAEHMGIRNFEDVSKHMSQNSFSLVKDYEMPANNRMLVFKKIERVQ
jgi:hypothetical protein